MQLQGLAAGRTKEKIVNDSLVLGSALSAEEHRSQWFSRTEVSSYAYKSSDLPPGSNEDLSLA